MSENEVTVMKLIVEILRTWKNVLDQSFEIH